MQFNYTMNSNDLICRDSTLSAVSPWTEKAVTLLAHTQPLDLAPLQNQAYRSTHGAMNQIPKFSEVFNIDSY
jgi:tetratricopeptide (TPR) repeat protein